MFILTGRCIRHFFIAIAILLFVFNLQINSVAQASSPLEIAEKVYRAGENFSCKPKGWLTGYSSETDFSFYGSYISVMPSPLKYDSTTDTLSLEFEKVYHIFKVIKRAKHSIVAQFYSHELESAGVHPLYGTVELKAHYDGEITLTVSNNGKSKSTDFFCGWEIDDIF